MIKAEGLPYVNALGLRLWRHALTASTEQYFGYACTLYYSRGVLQLGSLVSDD